MFTRFNTIHERDRHQDGQTPHDGIGRAYAGIARQKNVVPSCTGRRYKQTVVLTLNICHLLLGNTLSKVP